MYCNNAGPFQLIKEVNRIMINGGDTKSPSSVVS